MKGLLCFLFAFSVLFAANHASATGEAEEAIKSVFAVYKETWNQKDADGLISLFHEEAKIMEGYKNPQIKSKSEYRDLLPAKFKKVGSVKFKKIKINATDHFLNIWPLVFMLVTKLDHKTGVSLKYWTVRPLFGAFC